MKIYRSISSLKPIANLCITIGTFDGIHLGHKKILDQLKNSAHKIGGESMVITFDPHPRVALGKDAKKLRFITTLEEKIEHLEQMGIDHLLIIPFTKDFAAYTADDFINQILLERLGAKRVVVGYDHHFGKPDPNSPSIDFLLKENGIDVDFVDQLIFNGRAVSSTKIRLGLQEGRIIQASQCLGYTYSIKATIEDGLKQGREIGFPTANLRLADIKKVIPKNGVYVVSVNVEDHEYMGMMNIGYKPTLTEGIYSLEVHLIDFDGDLYQKELEVSFLKFIREEKKFGSREELIAQIGKDKESVLNYTF